MKGQLWLIYFLGIRLEMIITSSFRKRLGFGEVEQGKKGAHEELETHKPLLLLQYRQEIWTVQNFFDKISREANLTDAKGFPILDLTYVLEWGKVGSYLACFFWNALGKFLTGLFMLATYSDLRACRQEGVTSTPRFWANSNDSKLLQGSFCGRWEGEQVGIAETPRIRPPRIGTLMQRYLNLCTWYSLDTYWWQGPEAPCCDKHHSLVLPRSQGGPGGLQRAAGVAWQYTWGIIAIYKLV